MSTVSILPQLGMSVLQKYNLKVNENEVKTDINLSLDKKIDLSGNNTEDGTDDSLSKVD
tara:strand:- start:357 stop:533 length:177 start_codon:yes stop_codon:yes gene_type:complete